MSLSESDIDFLKEHHSAAMITVASRIAKASRVAVALVDGKVVE